MATNYDLTNTGAEVQERLNTVPDNTDAITELQNAIDEIRDGSTGSIASLEASKADLAYVDEQFGDIRGGSTNSIASLTELYIQLSSGKADAATTLEGYGIEDAYTKGAVDNMMEALTRSNIVVGALPTTGEENTIYRVPGDSTYSDYMYYGGEWVLLATYDVGSTSSVYNNPLLMSKSNWSLYGYYIASGGVPVTAQYGWDSYVFSPVGLTSIRVTGLTTYAQANISFFKQSVTSSDLISYNRISTADSGFVDIPDGCGVFTVSLNVNTDGNNFSLEFDTTNSLINNILFNSLGDYAAFTTGTKLGSSGAPEENSNFAATDYIELDTDNDTVIYYKIDCYTQSGIVLYDSSKNVVDVVLYNSDSSKRYMEGLYVFKPSLYTTAAYIRFCTVNTYIDSSIVGGNGNTFQAIKTLQNKIDSSIFYLEPESTLTSTYLDINTLELTSASGFTTYRYSVNANTYYRVLASMYNGSIAAIVALESETGNYTVIEHGGTGTKTISEGVLTADDTAYILLTQTTGITTDPAVENLFVFTKGSTDRTAWTEMVESDENIEKVFPNHVLNSRYSILYTFDFGTMYITADYVKPEKGESVTVTIYNGSNLTANEYIAVGNLVSFDKYQVESVSGTSVTIKLVEDNSPYYSSGDSVTAVLETSYESKELLQEYSCYVYHWDDILSLRSDDVPKSATTDNIHLTDAAYTKLGKMIAGKIRSLLTGSETRLVVYGDSWGSAGIYPQTAATELGLELLNKSRSGDSTMYISKRFVEDYNNGIITDTDFVIIQMGTNNLLRWGVNPSGSTGPVGQIMKDYKWHFEEDCKKITSLLNGNFLIIPGHAGATVYNPNL